jgi:uncharacterized membrane protein (DUF2068 family)
VQRSDRGVQLIIAYKLGRGALALLGGVILAIWISAGRTATLQAWADNLNAHWTSGVSSHLAHGLQLAVSGRRVWLVAIGLAFDGSLTMLEGYALQRGYTWGPYLIVIVTSLLLPVEAIAWVHRPTIGRACLFVLNAAVAGYLAWGVLKERRARAQQQQSPRADAEL